MANEADILKAETGGGPDTKRGGLPSISRPKRKRAFHRALKRGEYWAVIENHINLFARNLQERMFTKSVISLIKEEKAAHTNFNAP